MHTSSACRFRSSSAAFIFSAFSIRRCRFKMRSSSFLNEQKIACEAVYITIAYNNRNEIKVRRKKKMEYFQNRVKWTVAGAGCMLGAPHHVSLFHFLLGLFCSFKSFYFRNDSLDRLEKMESKHKIRTRARNIIIIIVISDFRRGRACYIYMIVDNKNTDSFSLPSLWVLLWEQSCAPRSWYWKDEAYMYICGNIGED